ncbi:MAG TPA: ABC-type transport auxiliary lipoprotein family protein [Castellaniella sp.]|uniref:PqiC family protein n=1 Tax=Castellaniella sp. TaxID=1955812 RepID=UPI002F05AD98
MNWKHCLGLALAVFLSGCASPQLRYYSLAGASTAARVIPEALAPAGYELSLRVSRIPAEADRIQLVVVDPARAPAVQVLNDSLWVAPLRDQLQSQLGTEVAQRLRVPRRIGSSVAAGGLPTRDIVVQVTRFGLVWGSAAWLNATWTDRVPGTRGVKVCQASLSRPAGASVSSLVQAQQHLVSQLARLIAQPAAGASEAAAPNIVSKGCTF